MSQELSRKRIAFLVANVGVEQAELTSPWQAVEDAGGTPVLVAPDSGAVQAVHGDLEKGDIFMPDVTLESASADDFDALVLPGGVSNPDKLRLISETTTFVRGFTESGKPVASICHGPWTLIEADVLHGKTLTSWPSLRTDITNAGGSWLDAEVFTCSDGGFTLVTSRKPDDLEAFDKALVDAFSG